MKITVVTVCANSAAYIADTIRSVDSQSWTDVEHVVVDGASRDGTLRILAAHAQTWRRVLSEVDDGPYDAMNKGIRLASGDVIGFLNSDDFYAHQGVLERVADVMSDPQIDACYADLVYVDPMNTERIARYWKSRRYECGLCQKGWMPAHPTFFVRRSVYDQFGGFDVEFRRQADFELTLRLLEVHRIRSVYVPEVWVKMRTGGLSNSSVAGIIRGNIEAYRACKKNGYRVTPIFILRKVLSRVPQFFARPVGITQGHK